MGVYIIVDRYRREKSLISLTCYRLLATYRVDKITVQLISQRCHAKKRCVGTHEKRPFSTALESNF